MGDLELLLNQEGALKVQNENLRSLLSLLQQKGSERHRVATWQNRGPAVETPPVDWSNRILRALFLVLICVTVSRITFHIFDLGLLTRYGRIDWWGVILLALTAVVVVGVFVNLHLGYSTPLRREELKTISGLIQQV